MQFAAHAALEGGIDHLVLLHAGFALEGSGDDVGGVVIAVAGEVADGDDRIGQGFLDEEGPEAIFNVASDVTVPTCTTATPALAASASTMAALLGEVVTT